MVQCRDTGCSRLHVCAYAALVEGMIRRGVAAAAAVPVRRCVLLFSMHVMLLLRGPHALMLWDAGLQDVSHGITCNHLLHDVFPGDGQSYR